MQDFFISDLHFRHAKSIKKDKRPFKNIDSHDKKIIENWNNVVGKDDNVYILGDVGIGILKEIVSILKKLNGKKHLIVGNHDYKYLKNSEFANCFESINSYLELRVIDKKGRKVNLILSHWPITCFVGHSYGTYHFYGHVHNTWEWDFIESSKWQMEHKKHSLCRMYNVGAMMPYIQYTPKTFLEVIDGYNDFKRAKFKRSSYKK